MLWLSLFIFFLVNWKDSFQTEEQCEITITKDRYQPVILNLNYEFLYPEETTLKVKQNDVILVGCPGGKLPTGAMLEDAKCISNTNFLVGGSLVDLNDTRCDSKVKGMARYTNQSCPIMGREIEIGFQLPSSFLRVIQVCFDNVTYNPLYSQANLTRYIGDHEREPSQSFRQDNFYNIPSVNGLYKRNNQRATVNGLVGLLVNDTTYIQDGDDFYLARGHLTPKADYVYGYQQDITFHLVNAAPQWQCFNGGNWEKIEDSVRKLAVGRDWDLSTYTGTFGISTLTSIEGVEVPLYLYATGGSNELPVPQFYWKVVMHLDTKLAVVIIGVNNPYIEDISPYAICNDVSSKLVWLKFYNNTPNMGHIYACEVDEFREVVQYLPELGVSGLLI